MERVPVVEEPDEDEPEELEAAEELELEAEEELEFESGSEPEDPDDEEDLLLDEIAALDLAHERGLLDDERHERLRSATKARLVGLHSGAGAGKGRS